MKDIIAARRQAIQDDARCEGCGATLAFCKAQRGKDPTAPEWLGCCAMGTDLRPCRHFVDAGALLALVEEIESGAVRTVEEATPKPRVKKGMSWSEYLNQGEKWQPNGRPMVAVADMDPEWRYNASRFLERRAAAIEPKYTLAEALEFAAVTASPLGPSEDTALMIESDMERSAEERHRDPVTWIRTTTLYQALVADLPNCSIALDAIADRAKHWSTCPARTGYGECLCEELRLRHQADEEVRLGVPEWTS